VARCRFVQPELVRIDLSDGDWIEVKRELNAGESRRVAARLVKTMHFNERAEVDAEQVGFSKVVEYLIDWSLVDIGGRHVPVSEASIRNLESATYTEIEQAIERHEAAVEAAREARKNGTGGERKSDPISSSAA